MWPTVGWVPLIRCCKPTPSRPRPPGSNPCDSFLRWWHVIGWPGGWVCVRVHACACACACMGAIGRDGFEPTFQPPLGRPRARALASDHTVPEDEAHEDKHENQISLNTLSCCREAYNLNRSSIPQTKLMAKNTHEPSRRGGEDENTELVSLGKVWFWRPDFN